MSSYPFSTLKRSCSSSGSLHSSDFDFDSAIGSDRTSEPQPLQKLKSGFGGNSQYQYYGAEEDQYYLTDSLSLYSDDYSDNKRHIEQNDVYVGGTGLHKRVVPDQSTVQDTVVYIDDLNSPSGDLLSSGSWQSLGPYSSPHLLEFEKVLYKADLQGGMEEQERSNMTDEILHSSDWPVFEYASEETERHGDQDVQDRHIITDEFLHSSDWPSFEDEFDGPEYLGNTEEQDQSSITDEFIHSSDWPSFIEAEYPSDHEEQDRSSVTEEYLNLSDWAKLENGYEGSDRLGSPQHNPFSEQHGDFITRDTARKSVSDQPKHPPQHCLMKTFDTMPCQYMTTSPQTSEWVLENLELVICKVLGDLSVERIPSIEMSSRTKVEAIIYDRENGVVRRKEDRSPIQGILGQKMDSIMDTRRSKKRNTRKSRGSKVTDMPPDELADPKNTTEFSDVGGISTTPVSYTQLSPYGGPRSRKFSCILRTASLIHESLAKKTIISKRDVFYRDVNLFGSQPAVDAAVDDIACTLRVPRLSLNVTAGRKSILYGSIRLTIRSWHKETNAGIHGSDGSGKQQQNPAWLQHEISESAFGGCSVSQPSPSFGHDEDHDLYSRYRRTEYSTPVTLPGMMSDIAHIEIHPKTRFVLVIEKEATLTYLAGSGFCETQGPCVLLTSKGYPDIVARQLLKRLEHMIQDGVYSLSLQSKNANDPAGPGSVDADIVAPLLFNPQKALEIPLLALVDCDLHGIKIFLTYRCGSVQCAFDNANLAVPSLECLGQLPSDWDPIFKKGHPPLLQDRLQRQLIPLSARERSLLDPWAKHHAWRQHALFTRSARIGTMFPGLGIATVAFAAYLGYEYITAPKADAHHGEAHH
ncbi:endodeoxyribonuclease [Mortierella sp. GBA30]|nr:endodeoxyribonuclease [Mortierella sp. GBA30]